MSGRKWEYRGEDNTECWPPQWLRVTECPVTARKQSSDNPNGLRWFLPILTAPGVNFFSPTDSWMSALSADVHNKWCPYHINLWKMSVCVVLVGTECWYSVCVWMRVAERGWVGQEREWLRMYKPVCSAAAPNLKFMQNFCHLYM